VNSNGQYFEELLVKCEPKMTVFTGSSRVADRLTQKLNGRIKVEDAGLDWKLLGPDVANINEVAFMIEHDSYALSGQKCSAESLLFVHENWAKTDVLERVKKLAMQRSIKELTNGPILSWNNKQLSAQVDEALKVPNTKLLFGGKPISEQHSIPECYGAFQPSAIQTSLDNFSNEKHYKTLTKEVFAPFQIVVEYKDSEIDKVINIIENLEQKLTCGVVSNDVKFLNKVLSNSSNGVTYCGIRARTTGAPQNHWFGPGGDPRAGGIGTIEAIRSVWSFHREIVTDYVWPNTKLVQS